MQQYTAQTGTSDEDSERKKKKYMSSLENLLPVLIDDLCLFFEHDGKFQPWFMAPHMKSSLNRVQIVKICRSSSRQKVTMESDFYGRCKDH